MVTLYSNNCPKCKVLEALLHKNKIEYTKSDDMQTILERGFTHAPVLEENGAFMTYGEAIKYLNKRGNA